MALRTGHGNGKGVPRVEVMPVDELPAGIAAGAAGTAPIGSSSADHDSAGKFTPGNSTSRKGGRARAERKKQIATLGLREVHPNLQPYITEAKKLYEHELGRLAREVGGGHIGATVSSMLQSAFLQWAASRAAFASGDMKLASSLANDSRQNLLASHELCAREAASRKRADEAAKASTNPFIAAIADRAQRLKAPPVTVAPASPVAPVAPPPLPPAPPPSKE